MCVSRVRDALEKVPGVTNVVIDFETKLATVKGKGVEAKTLVSAVDDIPDQDYTAKAK